MLRLRTLYVVPALLAPVVAHAEPSAATASEAPAAAPAATATAGNSDASEAPDLQLHHAPTRLHMRNKLALSTAQAGAAAPATPATKPAPSAEVTADANIDQKYHPLPTDMRDLQERTIFKINAGYELDSAPASGQTLLGGAQLPAGFQNTRNFIVGDAVLGTKDIILPSLNGYFLANYQFDTNNTIASRTEYVVPGDATDQHLAIKAGYAEYGTEDKDGAHFWLRAGRQYREDGGAMFAYFDGATVGYRTSAWSVSAFGGQRTALYVDTPTGVTFGATASVDLKKWKNLPAKISLDYQGQSVTYNVPEVNDASTTANASATLRMLIAASANIDLGQRGHLDLKVRAIDGGGGELGLNSSFTNTVAPTDGFVFGRASARLKYAISRDTLLVLDVQQRGAGDLAFDLSSPTAVDVVDLARQVGLGTGIYQPVATTDVGAQLDVRKGNKELMLFGRGALPEGTPTDVDQEGWLEGGVALAGSPIAKTWITAQYLFRDYLLQDSANAVGAEFGDTSSSGLSSMHEMSIDGWWRVSAVRIGLGGFYRIYNLASPYVNVTNDGRGGGRADLQYSLTKTLHVQLSGEVAQSDPTLMREIGTLVSARAAVEARW